SCRTFRLRLHPVDSSQCALSEFVVDTGVAEQLISGACWAVLLFARPPASTSLVLDPGQGVLDPGRRPGAPRHGEELEPLLDEEVRVHPGRDEIHRGGDAVLCGGRLAF